MIEMKAIITGKVQGVRFRDYVQGAAGDLGVKGYVKNQTDGSVLVVAQGEPELLKALVEYLHEGSLLAVVEDVSVEWRTSVIIYDDFSLLID